MTYQEEMRKIYSDLNKSKFNVEFAEAIVEFEHLIDKEHSLCDSEFSGVWSYLVSEAAEKLCFLLYKREVLIHDDYLVDGEDWDSKDEEFEQRLVELNTEALAYLI